jgi:hypothetical protein
LFKELVIIAYLQKATARAKIAVGIRRVLPVTTYAMQVFDIAHG